MNSINDFTLPNQDGEEISWSSYRGKYLVLYFYPRDNTPGCTTEAVGFTALKDEFTKLNCEVVGVSKDSVKKHPEFLTRLKDKTMMKRIGRAEELSGALLLLLSNASTFMTGSNITVDGGWTAW